MLSRTDFITMTILAAVGVVVVPFLLIFIDVNVWVKVMWALLAVLDVFFWSRTYVMYKEGKAQNREPVKWKSDKNYVLFHVGAYTVAFIVAFCLVGSLEFNNKASEFLSICFTFLAIYIPIMLWHLNSKIKEEVTISPTNDSCIKN